MTPKKFGVLLALITISASLVISSCASQSAAAGAGYGTSAANSFNAASGSSNPNPANVGASHDVTLNWSPSVSSGVLGYNIYRGTVSGGPYMRLNQSTIGATNYTDTAVQSGQTYFYVVTATSTASGESTYSNEVVASIP